MKDRKTGIIIQARLGSSRLPNKIILPYYRNYSIIELLVAKLRMGYSDIPFVIATTESRGDDLLADKLERMLVKVYRGSEHNVLKRFIDCARLYKFENIIRICADNPFIDIKGTLGLLKIHLQMLNDYTGYQIEGNLPSIKSHLGLWGEIVRLKSLEKVSVLTNKKIYQEHVTNYIYEHKEAFNVFLQDAPKAIYSRNDIRLTVDTKEDFETSREIYEKLLTLHRESDKIRHEDIVSFLDKNKQYLSLMNQEIKRNSK